MNMNRKLLFLHILLAGLVLGPAFGQEEKPPATPPSCRPFRTPHSAFRIRKRSPPLRWPRAPGGLLSQPRFEAALWGVKIVSLDTGKTLFEHNAGKLLSPASNVKLYTVALALDRLGPDYRIRTSLYAKTRPEPGGALQGDVIVYGRGDPTINARLHGGDILKALEPLAAALTNAGVKRIAGDLVGDTSFFRGPEFGSGWAWDDQEHDYGAEISSLTINNNTLQARGQARRARRGALQAHPLARNRVSRPEQSNRDGPQGSTAHGELLSPAQRKRGLCLRPGAAPGPRLDAKK